MLTSEYPPFFGGGISTYCYHTANMLAQNGHEVSVFVSDPTQKGVAAKEDGKVRVIRFSPTQTSSSSFLGHITNTSYEFAEVVRQFVQKEGKPDVIEAQEYLGIAYYLLQFKKLLYDWCRDIPVLITAHSPSFLYLEYNHVPRFRYPNYWIGEMERFCLQAADQVVSPSEYLLKELSARFDLTNRNVTVVPNPYRMSMEEIIPAAVEDGQIIFYGKLSAQKGIFKLLEYFKELWQEGFDQPLYLIGGTDIVYHPKDKAMGDVVREQYREYIGKGLLFLEGRIQPTKLPERLRTARLVLVPSTVDNLPYVVLEMMALGKIVLASKQGGQAEVIEDGLNGFLFDHSEVGSFARQLKKILSLNGEKVARIGSEARETVSRRYDFDSIYTHKMRAVNSCMETACAPQGSFPFLRQRNNPGVLGREALEPGLLSVIIPYYNMGAYINETLQSLEAADYPSMEIIVINDGTTDQDSLDRLTRYRNKPGIRIYDTPNNGLASARNYGAMRSTGEFIAFLDADDKIGAGFYSHAIRVLKQYSNVYFAGCWTKYFDGSTKTWPTFSPEPPLILYHNTINSSALVYKREAFLKNGLNDLEMNKGLEDYESVISMVSNGLNGVVLPEVFFYYRVRPDSMVRGINKAQKLILYEHISRKYSSFYGNFGADLFDLLNANGPGIDLDNPSLDFHLTDKLPFGEKFSGQIISLVKRNKYIKTIAYKVYRLLNK